MTNAAQISFRPKPEKIVELLLYLAHKRPGADHYQAVKFFYLADKLHLNRYGRPITFERYCALPYGPVASIALDLLKGDSKALQAAKIKELPFETRKLDKIIYMKEPKRAVDYDLFSKSDLMVFDEILRKYGKYNFDQLYRLTHSHAAYKNAWSTRGTLKSVPMKYEDMIEESAEKAEMVDELSVMAPHMG